jgi:hypothetical protein
MSEKPQEPLGEDNKKDVTFLSLFNPKEPRSDSTVKEERLAVCRQCEFFNNRLQQCGKCGCFMLAKTTLERAHCPIMKW